MSALQEQKKYSIAIEINGDTVIQPVYPRTNKPSDIARAVLARLMHVPTDNYFRFGQLGFTHRGRQTFIGVTNAVKDQNISHITQGLSFEKGKESDSATNEIIEKLRSTADVKSVNTETPEYSSDLFKIKIKPITESIDRLDAYEIFRNYVETVDKNPELEARRYRLPKLTDDAVEFKAGFLMRFIQELDIAGELQINYEKVSSTASKPIVLNNSGEGDNWNEQATLSLKISGYEKAYREFTVVIKSIALDGVINTEKINVYTAAMESDTVMLKYNLKEIGQESGSLISKLIVEFENGGGDTLGISPLYIDFELGAVGSYLTTKKESVSLVESTDIVTVAKITSMFDRNHVSDTSGEYGYSNSPYKDLNKKYNSYSEVYGSNADGVELNSSTGHFNYSLDSFLTDGKDSDLTFVFNSKHKVADFDIRIVDSLDNNEYKVPAFHYLDMYSVDDIGGLILRVNRTREKQSLAKLQKPRFELRVNEQLVGTMTVTSYPEMPEASGEEAGQITLADQPLPYPLQPVYNKYDDVVNTESNPVIINKMFIEKRDSLRSDYYELVKRGDVFTTDKLTTGYGDYGTLLFNYQTRGHNEARHVRVESSNDNEVAYITPSVHAKGYVIENLEDVIRRINELRVRNNKPTLVRPKFTLVTEAGDVQTFVLTNRVENVAAIDVVSNKITNLTRDESYPEDKTLDTRILSLDGNLGDLVPYNVSARLNKNNSDPYDIELSNVLRTGYVEGGADDDNTVLAVKASQIPEGKRLVVQVTDNNGAVIRNAIPYSERTLVMGKDNEVYEIIYNFAELFMRQKDVPTDINVVAMDSESGDILVNHKFTIDDSKFNKDHVTTLDLDFTPAQQQYIYNAGIVDIVQEGDLVTLGQNIGKNDKSIASISNDYIVVPFKDVGKQKTSVHAYNSDKLPGNTIKPFKLVKLVLEELPEGESGVDEYEEPLPGLIDGKRITSIQDLDETVGTTNEYSEETPIVFTGISDLIAKFKEKGVEENELNQYGLVVEYEGKERKTLVIFPNLGKDVELQRYASL